MPVVFDRPSMAAGEISSAIAGRVDLAKYQVGMTTMLNWFVHPFGGASTRSGTQIVGEVYDSSVQHRLIPFQFRDRPDGQNYVLVIGNGKMQIAMNGGMILEALQNITAITNANPGKVTIAAHGYATGDQIWIDGVVGMTAVNQRRFTITVVDVNNFTIGIDTTAAPYSAYTSGGAGARVYTVNTAFAAADLPLVKYAQNADTMTMCHPSYVPKALTRTAHTAWTFTDMAFGPKTPAPTAPTAGAGSAVYVITAVDPDTREESLPSVSVTGGTTINWTNVPGPTVYTYNVYKQKNGLYGFIGSSSSGVVGFADTGPIAPDMTDSPPNARQVFNSANNYPGCTEYHDGRRWFGFTNTVPQGIYSSQSAYENNFNVSIPVKDSDAITRNIRSKKVNYIRHLVSMNDLIIMTSGAEFKASAGANTDFLTPGACVIKAQAFEGCSDIPPVTTKDALVFVSGSNKKVLDLNYNALAFKWEERDLSILSSHLFENNTITEWAYAKNPSGIIWCVRDDGVLLGFTYLKEHDVYAWHRHTTDGFVESVAVIEENNETALYMIVRRTIQGVTRRFVERMATRVITDVAHAWCLDSARRYDGWNTNTASLLKISGATYNAGDAVTLAATGFTPFTAASVGVKYLLRDATSQSQVSVTITAFTNTSTVTATLDQAPAAALQNLNVSDWSIAITAMTGLWHLEGKTVRPLVDGNVHPDVVVANGTAQLVRAVGTVLAGLPYTCDLETLTPAMNLMGSSIQGLPQALSHTTVRVRNSRGLEAGQSFTNLKQIKERTTENYGWPTALQTGDEDIDLPASWSKRGHVCIRQEFPLPSTVVGIFPRINVGDAQ